MDGSYTDHEERARNGEFLDWTAQDCHLMTEEQFMTAQAACSQAWGTLQHYMRDTPWSVFTEICEGHAPYLLTCAIINTFGYVAESVACALASGPTRRFKPLTVDQLCDAALEKMCFLVVRDEFGVDIVGDTITFSQATSGKVWFS